MHEIYCMGLKRHGVMSDSLFPARGQKMMIKSELHTISKNNNTKIYVEKPQEG